MADNNEEDNNSNVVPIRRGSEAVKANFRKRKNEFFDKLMGPEQVDYKTGKSSYDDEEPIGPIEPQSALGKHIAGAIANSGLEGLHQELNRLGHFNTGGKEASITHINVGRENKYLKNRGDDNGRS